MKAIKLPIRRPSRSGPSLQVKATLRCSSRGQPGSGRKPPVHIPSLLLEAGQLSDRVWDQGRTPIGRDRGRGPDGTNTGAVGCGTGIAALEPVTTIAAASGATTIRTIAVVTAETGFE